MTLVTLAGGCGGAVYRVCSSLSAGERTRLERELEPSLQPRDVG